MKNTSIYILLLILISNITILKAQNKSDITRADSFNIVHYGIHLDIMNFTAKQIKGFTEVTVSPKVNSINNVTLDLLKLTIDSVFADNSKVINYTYNDTLIKIPLGRIINSTDTARLKVYYHGKPQIDPSTTNWGGFKFTGDYAFNLGVGMKSNPHSIGRFWFPCIDDFRSKSLYDIYIRTENSHTAVCGGTLKSVTDNGDGTRTFHWNLKSVIPTYLASVAVSNYVAVKDTFDGMKAKIPIMLYVNTYDINNATLSFKNLKAILKHFEKEFGPYEWERVGYVGVPFDFGAMEHATNITYPINAIDGTLSNEKLYAHELSHHWFGDLVTCSTAEDMWMNEGWAAYCESVFVEGIYGNKKYKDFVRANHKYVLQFLDKVDNGYKSIYGLPADYTYSSTVYDKGADVVHTLRNYLGDSLFYKTVKEYLKYYAFSNANTAQLKDFFAEKSEINLNDFFNSWVYGKGFPHFSVDSFSVVKNTESDYSVRVYVRQRLKGTNIYSQSNKLEITFMTNNPSKSYTDTIKFSGQYGNSIFHLAFNPVLAMLDINEKVQDATTDNYQELKKTGSYDFPNTYFYLTVNNITDSVFVRAEHNWVAPDKPKKQTNEIIRISDSRYWKIDADLPENINAKGRFYFSRNLDYANGFLDNTLLPAPKSSDSLILLYRRNTADDWRIINFTKTGNTSTGYLYTDNIKPGEYCFGIGKPNQSGIEDLKNINNSLSIYPNPSSGNFEIEYVIKGKAYLNIYDIKGSLVDSMNVESGHNIISWEAEGKKAGTYVFKLSSFDKKIEMIKSVIKL